MLRGLAHAEYARVAIDGGCLWPCLATGLTAAENWSTLPRPQRHRCVERHQPSGRVRSAESREVEGRGAAGALVAGLHQHAHLPDRALAPRRTPTSCSCSRSIARAASSCGSTKFRGCRRAGAKTSTARHRRVPVTDGANVYFFFQDFGLISYTADGKERWRHAARAVQHVLRLRRVADSRRRHAAARRSIRTPIRTCSRSMRRPARRNGASRGRT